MYVLIYFYLITLVCTYRASIQYNKKVVGGYQVQINQFPYLVSISPTRRQDSHTDCLCGGTIIDIQWVVTAGHCVVFDNHNATNKPYTLSILAGSTNCFQYDQSKVQFVRIKKLFLHPQYNLEDSLQKSSSHNDIALLYLERPLSLGENVKMVKLATPSLLKMLPPEKVFTKACQAMGWGFQEENIDVTPPELFTTRLTLIDMKECIRLTKQFFVFEPDKMLCTLDKKSETDVCTGDSGGPLICDDYQVGIVSMGYGCARENSPNLWLRVDAYIDWIHHTILTVNSSKKIKINNTLFFLISQFYIILNIN